jgi:hypothetical protein
MEKGLKKILFGLAAISVVLIAVGLILFKTLLAGKYFVFFPLLVLFMFLINAGFFIFFYRSLQQPANAFIRAFMASTGAKLVIYLVLILTYVLTSPKTALVFAITLFVMYLTYSVYDLWIMLTLLKQKKENSN